MNKYILIIDHQSFNFYVDSYETIPMHAANRNEARRFARRIARQNNRARIVSLKLQKAA